MLSSALLRLLRYSLYLTAITLAVIELIVDAVALAALNDTYRGFSFSFTNEKGAAGYTMFVTIVTLLFIPIVTFANILVNRGFGAAARFNQILTELSNTVFFLVLWFIAGVVMAVYAGSGDCFGFSVCKKFKAATAFAWLPFFVFLAQTAVLVLILLRIRANGGNMKSMTHDIDGDAGLPTAVAAPPQHVETPYSQPNKGEGAYYNSNPQVDMPVAPPAQAA
ncbi:hypothetical protein IWW36_001626 [Coemansia brasiliensis]|uniref:MARVEL domain-containing protein n=1 Tax=Coemansia brasiliensis TaxID=2650707 RepID=A0A9W8IF36_9FUNG|nr:hypothetical protein IWW36_001626 [Coemansia brasiliensis]